MYAKVFRQMYDGTLATNGPWEALVTFQQMLVLANDQGEVDMTASAIARVTTIPLNIIERGIGALLAPDPESRTPAEEGRRLVPLSDGRSWGWRVVNYVKYRQIQKEQERRDYHRKYYHEKRKKTVESVDNVELNALSTASTASTDTEEEAEEVIHHQTPRKRGPASVHGFPPGFESFWSAYPRKVAKPAAAQAFARLKADEALLAAMLAALRQQALSADWTKERGRFVPHPATWLHHRRWEDVAAQSGSVADDIFAGSR